MDLLIAEVIKNPVSAYGAIVASIALCFSFLSLLVSFWVASRDRARIIVTGRSNYKVHPPGRYGPDQRFIVITVSNLGRRPRTISHVGVRLKDRSQLMATDSFHKGPQVIAEATSDSWSIAYEGQSKLSLDSVKSVWAVDQTGKIYRGKIEVALEELELRS